MPKPPSNTSMGQPACSASPQSQEDAEDPESPAPEPRASNSNPPMPLLVPDLPLPRDNEAGPLPPGDVCRVFVLNGLVGTGALSTKKGIVHAGVDLMLFPSLHNLGKPKDAKDKAKTRAAEVSLKLWPPKEEGGLYNYLLEEGMVRVVLGHGQVGGGVHRALRQK